MTLEESREIIPLMESINLLLQYFCPFFLEGLQQSFLLILLFDPFISIDIIFQVANILLNSLHTSFSFINICVIPCLRLSPRSL